MFWGTLTRFLLSLNRVVYIRLAFIVSIGGNLSLNTVDIAVLSTIRLWSQCSITHRFSNLTEIQRTLAYATATCRCRSMDRGTMERNTLTYFVREMIYNFDETVTY